MVPIAMMSSLPVQLLKAYKQRDRSQQKRKNSTFALMLRMLVMKSKSWLRNLDLPFMLGLAEKRHKNSRKMQGKKRDGGLLSEPIAG